MPLPNRVHAILSNRSIAWAENGLLVVLDGLVGKFLCFSKIEAALTFGAAGLLVLASMRSESVWPTTYGVPMGAVGGRLGDPGGVDHPELLSQRVEVMLDHLTDLFGLVVLVSSVMWVAAIQRSFLHVDLDGVTAPTTQQLHCVQQEPSPC